MNLLKFLKFCMTLSRGVNPLDNTLGVEHLIIHFDKSVQL